MTRLSEFDRLVGETYDCLAEGGGWSDLLASYANVIGGDSALVYVKARGGSGSKILTSIGFDPSYRVDTYLSYYESRSPFFPLYKKNPQGLIQALGDYAFSRAYRETEYFQDWVRPQGYGDMVGGHLLRNQHHYAWLSIRRAERRGTYSTSEIGAINRLARHLGRAISLRFKLEMERTAPISLRKSLEFVGFGVIIVDGNSKILIANRVASNILKVGAGLKSQHGRLVCEQARDTGALHVAVAAAQRQVVDGAVATDFCVGRSAAHVPLTLHVVPLPSASARQDFVSQSAVAVFVIDPLHGGPDAGGFARAYGLTPAEHRVLHEIIQGTGVVEAAAKIRVAVPTARTQLQHIFQKTNTTSQAELVRLVMLSPLQCFRKS